MKLVVSNARLHESGLLAALLGTVAPNGTPMLGLVDCSLSAAAFMNCAAHLATTTRLAVHGCLGIEPGNPLGPALDFMLRQAPQLRSLEVDSSQSAGSSLGLGPPPEIATLRHLTFLELVGTQLPHLEGVLEGLPGGKGTCGCVLAAGGTKSVAPPTCTQRFAVVADLAHLDVRSNRLRRLPASLSQCTKLTALLLGHNDDLDPLGFDDASVLTLASLPALKRVQLPYTPASFGFRLKLKAAAPHIKDISIPS